MSLVVEDGTGKEDAESYASVADTNAYFEARGIATWTGTDAAKEAALRLGTEYLEAAYRGRWRGYRTGELQALAWPRTGDGTNKSVRIGRIVPVGLLDEDGFEIGVDTIPTAVKRATMEAALLSLTGTDFLAAVTTPGSVKRTKKQVGSLLTETEYASAGGGNLPRFPKVEYLLRTLVTAHPEASVSNVKLIRG